MNKEGVKHLLSRLIFIKLPQLNLQSEAPRVQHSGPFNTPLSPEKKYIARFTLQIEKKQYLRNGICQIAGEKYEPSFSDNVYKVYMKLMIRSVAMSDYGSYKCISKNSLGETDGSIKLYREYIPVI